MKQNNFLQPLFVTVCSLLFTSLQLDGSLHTVPVSQPYVYLSIAAQSVSDQNLVIADPILGYPYPYFGGQGLLTPGFETFWYDDDALIIGVTHRRTGADFNQTIIYHPSDGTSAVLSDFMTRAWARNPVTGLLAFRAFTTSGFEPVNASIKLATYQNDTLTVDTTLPSGCDLAWSPDGATLAYTLRGAGRNDCTQPVTALAFYDVAAGTTQQVDVSGYQTMIPVGWVDRPAGDLAGNFASEERR